MSAPNEGRDPPVTHPDLDGRNLSQHVSDVERYASKADELLREAARTVDDVERRELLRMAAQWRRLETEARERTARKPVAE